MSDTMEKQTRQSTGPESNNKRQRKATNGNNSPSLSQVARARADANLDGASLTVPLLSTIQLSGNDNAQASLSEAPTNNVVNQSSSDPNISSGPGVEAPVTVHRTEHSPAFDINNLDIYHEEDVQLQYQASFDNRNNGQENLEHVEQAETESLAGPAVSENGAAATESVPVTLETLLLALNGLTITVNGLAEKTNAQNNLLFDYNARLGKIEEIVRDQSNGQVGQVNAEDGGDAPAEVALPPLPIKKISQLKQFSDDLAANPKMVELLTELIGKVGGKKVQDRVRDAMDDIFSKRLGKKYKWNGYKGGKKFKALAISKILRKAFVDAKSCSNSAETKTHISEWFRRAGQRYEKDVRDDPQLEDESSADDEAPDYQENIRQQIDVFEDVYWRVIGSPDDVPGLSFDGTRNISNLTLLGHLLS
ncbi:hypothetical protein QAD02_011846 [Eretmocerus hayati]|uniref:Uncharacterized protein n=1 Tax=Eretmocerus hayati TaxID=131215 RepID=A0ACC2NXM9_9HYME|nr:hypothetical protein QAD02_011846 [Eretmocerus hayati]